MNRRRAFAAAAAIVIAVLGGAAAFLARKPEPERAATPEGLAWTEVGWPFPLDPWGPGRAFRCKAADCGSEVTLYLRAKLGLCNCTTGVADDEHLDGIGDVDLVSSDTSALGRGRTISVHWMQGRSRGYAVRGGGRRAKSVLSIAFNDRCDVIIATAAVGSDDPNTQEAAARTFLNSPLVLRWAETTLGL